MKNITNKTYRVRKTYSIDMHHGNDGSWNGAVITPHGVVMVNSDVQQNQTMFRFVTGGLEHIRWIDHATTPQGAATLAGRFVRWLSEKGPTPFEA